MASTAGAGDKKKAAEPFVATAAAAAARNQQRSRRRRRAGMRGYAHEFMEMNINVDPDWAEQPSGSTATSDRGSGPLGFSGTVHKSASAAAGLITLDDDEFGSGAVLPMMPGTWSTDGEAKEND
jgi:PPE-repeat protein